MAQGTLDRTIGVAFVLCVVFLGFVGGAYVVLAQVFPYPFLRDAYAAGTALMTARREQGDLFTSGLLWQPARSRDRGVVVHDRERAQPGYTLYTSGHAPSAFLIDMDGKVVHEWHLPYSAVHHPGAAVKRPLPDDHVFIFRAVMLPNGDLLAVYDGAGDTPYGYGLVKMDADSNVLWSYLENVHHDVDVAPDGSIYTLTHAITGHEIEGREHLQPPRIDDFVVHLSADGRELAKVPVTEALAGSPYASLLDLVPWHTTANGDYLHANAVDFVDEATAAAFPFLSPGQVVVSLREIGAIGAVDMGTGRFTWTMRGPWIAQHDPELLANGNILLFDNKGHFGPGGTSRVIEVDPETRAIAWTYAGTADDPLESAVRSAQDRLANGNTLITESDGGRLLEVTPDGDIVWSYVNPVRGGPDDGFIPVMGWALRIDPAGLDADFRRSLAPSTASAPQDP